MDEGRQGIKSDFHFNTHELQIKSSLPPSSLSLHHHPSIIDSPFSDRSNCGHYHPSSRMLCRGLKDLHMTIFSVCLFLRI